MHDKCYQDTWYKKFFWGFSIADIKSLLAYIGGHFCNYSNRWSQINMTHKYLGNLYINNQKGML